MRKDPKAALFFLNSLMRAGARQVRTNTMQMLVANPAAPAAEAAPLARSWRRHIFAALGLTAVGTAIHFANTPPAFPVRIRAGDAGLISLDELRFAGIADGRSGHNETAKYEREGTGEYAYVKKINPRKLTHEILYGHLQAAIMKRVFGREIAPKPQIVADETTLLSTVANTIHDAFAWVGVVSPRNDSAYTTLKLFSPVKGQDQMNLGLFIQSGATVRQAENVQVTGLGIAILLRALFVGDSNSGNFVFNFFGNGDVEGMSIDHEIPGEPLFFDLNASNPRAAMMRMLQLGAVTETTDPEVQLQEMDFTDRLMRHGHEQQVAELNGGDGDIEECGRYTAEQTEVIAELASQDGPLFRDMYEAVAALTREQVESLIPPELRQHLDQEVLRTQIDRIMRTVESTGEFLEQQELGLSPRSQ